MDTRNNAWNHGGTFDNPDLLWYAKGVGEMMQRSLDDRHSWWFFAAIHGEYIDINHNGFPRWDFIPGPPSVPSSPLPSQSDRDIFWRQCQHQSRPNPRGRTPELLRNSVLKLSRILRASD